VLVELVDILLEVDVVVVKLPSVISAFFNSASYSTAGVILTYIVIISYLFANKASKGYFTMVPFAERIGVNITIARMGVYTVLVGGARSSKNSTIVTRKVHSYFGVGSVVVDVIFKVIAGLNNVVENRSVINVHVRVSVSYHRKLAIYIVAKVAERETIAGRVTKAKVTRQVTIATGPDIDLNSHYDLPVKRLITIRCGLNATRGTVLLSAIVVEVLWEVELDVLDVDWLVVLWEVDVLCEVELVDVDRLVEVELVLCEVEDVELLVELVDIDVLVLVDCDVEVELVDIDVLVLLEVLEVLAEVLLLLEVLCDVELLEEVLIEVLEVEVVVGPG
jgi:hypothetical protein